MTDEKLEERVERYQLLIDGVKKEIKKIIVGQKEVIDNLLVAIMCDGNVLLEGVPGVGKTMLVQSLGKVLDLDYSRIQFTPDLMPADIIGTNILMEDKKGKRYFDFKPGPLFAQLILADEINRATPKTQSALLEAMQEKRITVAGTTRKLQKPFFVLATENPIEMEGTYPLPEAQIDRFFFKLEMGYPRFNELRTILVRTTGEELPELKTIISPPEIMEIQKLIRNIPVARDVLDFVIRITLNTQPHQKQSPDKVKQYVRYGSSPRGAQALILAGKARAFLHGRYNVSFEDIRKVSLPALRHRILFNFEGEAAGLEIDELIREIVYNMGEGS